MVLARDTVVVNNVTYSRIPFLVTYYRTRTNSLLLSQSCVLCADKSGQNVIQDHFFHPEWSANEFSWFTVPPLWIYQELPKRGIFGFVYAPLIIPSDMPRKILERQYLSWGEDISKVRFNEKGEIHRPPKMAK